MSGPLGDEFSIQLARDFNERLPVNERSSVYAGIIWQFRRNPTYGGYNYDADRWVVELESDPSLVVFYTVDLTARIIVLLDLRRRDEL